MAAAPGELLVGRSTRSCSAICRLICFHWAGGGTSHFIKWAANFSDSLEVLAVRPPGRESRLREKPFQSIQEYVSSVGDLLKAKYMDLPFAFFGHSLGARLCFETARYLKKTYQAEPIHLFVSGTFPPHSQEGKDFMRTRNIPNLEEPDQAFIDYLTRLGGTPKEILENKEFLAFFIPPLRSDLGLLNEFMERDDVIPKPAVSCPITSFIGDEDTPWNKLQHGWKELTSGLHTNLTLKGGHFYLTEKENMDKLRTRIELEIHTCLSMPV